jgi:glucokinase
MSTEGAGGFTLAIDVGGTKLAAARVDDDGGVHRRRQVPTHPAAAGHGEALWATLQSLIDEVCDGQVPAGVGVGCGGPMRGADGTVSPLNLPAWRDFPLLAKLRASFPGVDVRLANDAIALAVGEHWRGAGRGSRNFLGMVVSTGVGGGLVIDDRVVEGSSGNAGHIGHVVVDPDGPACACGGRGCLEAVARGPAVVQWAVEHGWQPADDSPATGRSLLAAAHGGDAIAIAAFERAGTAVGVAIASAAHLLELEVVAIGGGISSAGELLLAPARATFSRHVRMAFAASCRIVPAALGGDAGLVGAAALVLRGDQYGAAVQTVHCD